MTDMQAAIGLEQIKKIDRFWKKRQDLTRQYIKALDGIAQVEVLTRLSAEPNKNAYHLFVIRLKLDKIRISRDFMLKALLAENIQAGVHYPALHLHPYYQKNFGYKKGMFENAEQASESIISLPLYPKMKKQDAADVINAVLKIIAYYKK
jgi:dTDP-4-amino-4,6-dideoxygalactose transaminase